MEIRSKIPDIVIAMVFILIATSTAKAIIPAEYLFPGFEPWHSSNPAVSLQPRFIINDPDSPQTELVYPFDDRFGDFVTDNPDNPFYLDDPSIIEKDVEYDPETNRYIITEKIGDSYYRNPTYLTFEEYLEYENKQSIREYWQERANAYSLVESKGIIPKVYVESNFFDKVFGGTTVDIRPSGNIDLTFGGNVQKIDNPTLTERQRKQGGFDFDMNINMSVIGKIGDKLKLTTNYNTQATFDFENQIKLQYEGEEDDIIKSIEGGNVSLPLNSSLITGSQSLFGVKTKLQFGRLTVTSVISQQKSKTENITIQNGAQMQEFEVQSDQYDENRHFFLAQYFRENYNNALSDLPLINSLVTITDLEVWVTNKRGATENTRDIVAFMDLGEKNPYNPNIHPLPGNNLPRNGANDLYQRLTATQATRSIDNVVATLQSAQFGLTPVQDFEKTYARKLSPSEYTFHPQLGYISLNQTLYPDEVLAVAFRYTYNGQVYQVGELAADFPPDSSATSSGTNAAPVLFLKMLKSTSVRPKLPIWDLMMKNVYSLGAFQVQAQDFKLDIYYVDPGGGIKRYIPEGNVIGKPLIRLLNLDNLNNNLDPQPDGVFDFIPGITINPTNGRIIFPVVEPFGEDLRKQFDDQNIADKYVYDILYDSTRVIARQFPEFNRYIIKGSYKSSVSSEISLGAFNIPQGSVKVTAGGQQLVENTHYTVDYNLGRIKIIDEGILNSGAPINVSFENNALFGFQTKSLFGTRLDYWINDHFSMGATVMKLTERPFTEKVNIGDDPISNAIYGFDFNYSTESNLLTRIVDKLPFYETKEPSSITVRGEVARLKPGHSRAIGKEGVVYIDDFEGTRSSYDLKFPAISWTLASTPQDAKDKYGRELFPEAKRINDLSYGYNRARLCWYNIDPLFLRNNSSTPAHIANNPEMQRNHYVREVLQEEVFPNKSSITPINTTILTFDLAYYPRERGPYNYEYKPNGEPGISAGVNPDGTLKDPSSRWGGIMRSIDNNDFEEANIEFIEFWVLDPFIYDSSNNGELYINLGNISEDILKDSRKFFENGLPGPNETPNLDTTKWGVVPVTQPITNAFDNDPDAREMQDVGFDGLSSTAEQQFFNDFLDNLRGYLHPDTLAKLEADPSSDDYHYYRGSDYDDAELGILARYKKYNNPDGNSPVSTGTTFSSAATNLPDSEDLNRDNTLNETEEYFQYRVELHPGMDVGENFITDKVVAEVNGERVTWYQFKIPIDAYERRVGNIPDFKSIRFIRMFLTGFEKRTILRFARLELVRNQWRRYDFSLLQPGEYIPSDNFGNTFFNVTAVNIEENAEREPIPYVLPPGIEREQNLTATNVNALQNEQSLSVQVCNLQDGDARAVYKTLNLDIRQYGRIKMFIHAESMIGEEPLNNGDLTAFIRLGSDFTSNYYEYEIPLIITPETNDPELIWPVGNELDLKLDSLILIKQMRNQANASVSSPFTVIDKRGNKITVVGNPDLGMVKTAMLGIRNPKAGFGDTDDGKPKCAEVWFNELRLTGFDEKGGWAALGTVDMQLADLGNVTFAANMHTIGFGQLEQKVDQRYKDNFFQYDVASTLQLGKFFPQKLGVRLPLYAHFSQSFSTPQYDPYELDVPLKDKLEFIPKDERSDYKRSTQDYVRRKDFNFTNVRIVPTKEGKKNYPWDISNWNLTYAFTETYSSDPIIESDIVQRHKAAIGYNYAPRPKYIAPFEKLIKSRSKYLNIIKDINFNFIPGNLSFTSDMNRQFGETILRPIGDEDFPIEPTYDKYFNWDRIYGLKYNPFKSLSIDFNATNKARIDEPEGRLDTKEKRDSVWTNILNGGRNIDYVHSTNVNYNLPINKIPIFDWIQVRASYGSNYNWKAGPLVKNDSTGKIEPSPLGNSVSNNQNIRLNGEFNFKNLYDKANVLKPYNQTSRPSSKKDKDKDNYIKQKENAQKDIDKTLAELEKNKQERKKVKGEIKTIKSENPPDKAEQVKAKKEDLKRLKKQKKQLKQRLKKQRQDKRKIRPPAKKGVAVFVKPLIALKRVSVNYTDNRNTFLPGFKPTTRIIGMDKNWEAPGWDFIFGYQPDAKWLDRAAAKGWIVADTNLNYLFSQGRTKSLNIRATVEPFDNLRVDINATRSESLNHTEYFKRQSSDADAPWEHISPQDNGSYSVSFVSMKTLFGKSDAESLASMFSEFENTRAVISQRLGEENPYSTGNFITVDSIPRVLPDYAYGYGPYAQDVLIPAFIAAYAGQDPARVRLNPFKTLPRPNWRITYNGLAKFEWAKKIFSSVNITHSYNSTLTINSFQSDLEFEGDGILQPARIDTQNGNFIPKYVIPQIVINEQLSPLIGIDMAFKNNLTAKFDFKKARNLSMSFVDYQLSESRTTEFTVGMGYRIRGLPLPFKWRGKKIRLENDVNFKLDLSFRDNKTINHKLDQNISEPTSGMKTIRISPSVDYVVNKRLSVKLFFDRNRTIPATSASYPITNTRAGVTIRFSLTQ